MKLYVYQINDTEYGAGLGYEACKRKGRIVEQWPLDTPDQALYAAKRGSAFNGVSPQVTRIADAARNLMLEDETFIAEMNKPPIVVKASLWETLRETLRLKSLVA